jgi:excisionase family DNA binding protein
MVDGKKICMPLSSPIKTRDEMVGIDRWMTSQEACVYLVCHERTLRKFISQGKITAYRLGHSYRFRQRDLDAALERISQAGIHSPSLDGFISCMADVRRAG